MDLVNLEFGKWVYLIIYLFFPAVTIIYLIKTFGLEVKEDFLTTAHRHIEQANYWADIALQAAQSSTSSKSLDSLEHTIQQNLSHAFDYIAQADPQSDEAKSLKKAYRHTEQKLRQIQMLMEEKLTPPISVSPSRQ